MRTLSKQCFPHLNFNKADRIHTLHDLLSGIFFAEESSVSRQVHTPELIFRRSTWLNYISEMQSTGADNPVDARVGEQWWCWMLPWSSVLCISYHYQVGCHSDHKYFLISGFCGWVDACLKSLLFCQAGSIRDLMSRLFCEAGSISDPSGMYFVRPNRQITVCDYLIC